MAELKQIEIRSIMDLFDSSKGPGYVLEFSNATFSTFIRSEANADIYDDRYATIGISKGKRLEAFLGQAPAPAVVKVLNGHWEHRERLRRMRQRESSPDGGADLARMIRKLGGTPVEGMGPAAPTPAVPPPRPAGPSAAKLQELQTSFIELLGMKPQPRGYAFEKFLKAMFDAWGMEARQSFRIVGEQIDGSFVHEGSTYLLEAKWQDAVADASALRSFQGKVEDRPDWTRGLFVSYAGFSPDGLQAFGARRLILMDGFDIHEALSRKLSLKEIVGLKARRASETGKPFVRVRDLMPG